MKIGYHMMRIKELPQSWKAGGQGCTLLIA